MATGYERYRQHPVWETLTLKRESLNSARYDDAETEQARSDIVEWLDEAIKTKGALQPALYLSALDALSTALNQVPVDNAQFRQFVANRKRPEQAFGQLEQALRALPLPPPKELKASYVKQLDDEVDARNERLGQLEVRVQETEEALAQRLSELEAVSGSLDKLRAEIEDERSAIKAVSEAADTDMRSEWETSLGDWKKERDKADAAHDSEALEHIATLAAVTKSSEVLAEHAAGDLSATDWYGRAKRERRSAQWMRFGAAAAFVFAGAVGFFVVSEAITNNFDLTLGDGVLRASVAMVIGAFGALLLRESGRHFREADAAEDVALSMKALAPFYANSDDDVRLKARVQVGDAVLVKNVLSRFSHRDAAKHATGVDSAQLPDLVRDATKALNLESGKGAGT